MFVYLVTLASYNRVARVARTRSLMHRDDVGSDAPWPGRNQHDMKLESLSRYAWLGLDAQGSKPVDDQQRATCVVNRQKLQQRLYLLLTLYRQQQRSIDSL